MSLISDNLKTIKEQLPEDVTLVAVSKTQPDESILEAYEAGQRIFGENKVQEMTSKYERLPKDIQWHMIGHLQRNKVKYIAPYVTLIHGVDSIRLLREINKQALLHQRVIPCLLQMHIARETTKFGLDEQELNEIISGVKASEFSGICIKGLMGMATFTEDQDLIRSEFKYLADLFKDLKQKFPASEYMDIQVLSMGMSGDYQEAIAQGSNMVRIGSSIFGSRNYNH